MTDTGGTQQPPLRTVVINGETYVVGGATVEEQNLKIADLQDDAVRDAQRGSIEGKIDATAALARDVSWDWLEAYGHPAMLNVPFIANQLQNVGVEWGALTVNQKAEELRRGVSYLFAIAIRFSQGFELLFDVTERQIAAARAVDAPPER